MMPPAVTRPSHPSAPRDTHSFVALGLLLIAATIIAIALSRNTAGLQSIPTCLYGCDYYYESGMALDITMNPTHLWQSSTHDYLGLPSSLPKTYFYLRGLLAAAARYPALEAWRSAIILSYILLFCGLIGWFVLYRKVLGNPYVAVLLAFLTMNIDELPYFKYRAIFMPFFPFLLLLLLQFFSAKSLSHRQWIAAALVVPCMTVIAHINIMAFFIAYFFLATGWLVFVARIDHPLAFTRALKSKTFWTTTALTTVVGISSLAINLLLGWYYRALFVFDPSLNASRFDIHVDLNNPANYAAQLVADARALLWGPGWEGAGSALCAILGMSTMIALWRRDTSDSRSPFLWLLLGTLVSIFNYVLTVPLTGRHLSAVHMTGFLEPVFTFVAAGYFLVTIAHRWRFAQRYSLVSIASVVLLLLSSFSAAARFAERIEEDPFWVLGTRPVSPHYRALDAWFQAQRMDPSRMVILSTNELSFALHGLYGVRSWVGRQSHFFMFGDFQQYWMDAAIVLYGQDNGARRHVLERYAALAQASGKQLYLYWDPFWIPSEWQPRDGAYAAYDPLRFEDDPERRRLLEGHGIQYHLVSSAAFEPSAQDDPHATRLPILYLTPANYRSTERPWCPDLDLYLEEMWSYSEDGQLGALLFKITL